MEVYDELISRNLIHERVRHLVLASGDTLISLSELLHMTKSTLVRRLDGTTEFTQNELIAICLKYGVSADWLLFGRKRE